MNSNGFFRPTLILCGILLFNKLPKFETLLIQRKELSITENFIDCSYHMSALFGDTQTIGTDKILVTSITYYRLTCEFDRANSLLNSQNKNYLQFIILIVVTCFPSLQSCFAQTLDA